MPPSPPSLPNYESFPQPSLPSTPCPYQPHIQLHESLRVLTKEGRTAADAILRAKQMQIQHNVSGGLSLKEARPGCRSSHFPSSEIANSQSSIMNSLNLLIVPLIYMPRHQRNTSVCRDQGNEPPLSKQMVHLVRVFGTG